MNCLFFIGWVYMILKYVVDRYNIYFVYKLLKINKKIYFFVINFVIVVIILF